MVVYFLTCISSFDRKSHSGHTMFKVFFIPFLRDFLKYNNKKQLFFRFLFSSLFSLPG